MRAVVPLDQNPRLNSDTMARDVAPVDIADRSRIVANRRDRIISIASPFGLLVACELAARIGILDVRFFPAPTSIAVALIELLASGELLDHTLISLEWLLWGALLGGIPALIIGLVIGLYRPVRALMAPLITATYPIPKSAILPLILLIFGFGAMSKIAMVAIGVFYPIAINATAGVREINKIYLDVGNSFKAGRWDTFRTIAFPGALPFVMTGVKLGIGMGLILIAIVLTFTPNELDRWLIPWRAER